MIRRDAVEDAERGKVQDLAAREYRLDEEIINLKEVLIPKLRQMAQFPLVITHIHPAKWSFNTVVNALGVLGEAEGSGVNVNLSVGPQAFDLSGATEEELEILEGFLARVGRTSGP
jgi:hypothetical protein